MAQGVLKAIAQGAPHRLGPHQCVERGVDVDLDHRRIWQTDKGCRDQRAERAGRGWLPCCAFSKGQIISEDRLHLRQIGAAGGDFLIRRHQRQRQFEAGDGRAQIVADAGQQQGARGVVSANAVAHVDKGLGGVAHLARPARFEARRFAAAAESVGGGGEFLDRADLIAHEQQGKAGDDQKARRIHRQK